MEKNKNLDQLTDGFKSSRRKGPTTSPVTDILTTLLVAFFTDR